MAYSIKTYAGIGSAGAFTTPEYLDPSHIEVYVEDVLKTVNTHYTITGTTVSFTAGNFPTSSNTIKIIRKSSQSTRLVDYTDGAVEVAATFDEDSKQSLFMAQEALDGAEATGTTVFQPLEVAPSTPLEGTVYYDASSDKLQFWNGSSFIAVADDAAVVKITGDQTVAGAKTFTDNVDVTGTVTADGVLLGDNDKLQFGDGVTKDLQIYHNSEHSIIEDVGTGNLVIRGANIELKNASNKNKIFIHNGADGSVRVSHGDAEAATLETTSTGIDVTGTVTASEGVLIPEGKKLRLGSETDSAGLDIYESTDGDSLINQYGDGNLIVKGQNILLRNNSDQTLISTVANTAQLFNRNGDNEGLKLETTNTGIDVTGTVTADGVSLGDNEQIQLGASGDLKIYHNGSHSKIEDTGTGNLVIEGTEVAIKDSDGNRRVYSENGDTGSARLYYGNDSTEKLATTAAGIDVTGEVKGDSLTIDNGTSFTGAYINSATGASVLTVKSTFEGGNEWQNVGVIEVGGHDKAYIDLKKPDTDDSDLRLMHNDNGSLTAFTGNLFLQTSSSNSGGKVALANGGNTRLETTSTGVAVTGTVTADGVTLGDNEKIQLGATQDLELFHDGTNSYVQDAGDGGLILNTTSGNGVFIHSATETMGAFHTNGAVNLYHDNVEKFATTDTGIDVTGTINCNNSLQIRSTGSDVDAMPDLYMSNLETAAAAQNLGMISFRGYNDATTPAIKNYGDVYAQQVVVTDGAEEGKLVFDVLGAGAKVEALQVTKDGIDVTGTVTAGGVTLDNNQKIKLGGAATPNLEIYETTAGHGLIVQNGAGNLVVKGQNGYLQNDAGNALVAWDGNHSELSWQGATGAGVKLATTDTGIEVTGTVEADDLKLPLFDSTSVTTNGSLDPVQVPYASTQDTLALLAVDPSGNVVKGSQEATWTFTKAQLDALTTSTTSGITLLSAAGSGKAVIVEESNWMIKYSGTGTMSANGFEVRQAHNGASDAGITRIPSGQINTIMSGLPTGNPSYGFYSRDLPQYNNDGRSYVTNKETFLTRITTNATPANLISISIKLKYRVFDVDTF